MTITAKKTYAVAADRSRRLRPPARRLLVYAIAHPTVLRTELEIDATPDEVWKVLTDRAALPGLESVHRLVDRRADGRRDDHQRPAGHQGRGDDLHARSCSPSSPARSCAGSARSASAAIFDGEHSFRIEPLPGGRSQADPGGELQRRRGSVHRRHAETTRSSPSSRAMNQALATARRAGTTGR